MEKQNLTLDDIKVGETYNVRVTVEGKGCNGCWLQARTGEHGSTLILRASEAAAFSPISPENGIKNTDPSPKYDPCRKFRKGDKVKLVARDGRSYRDYDPTTKLREEAIYTVLEDESDVIEGGCPDIRIADEHAEYEVLFYFLELVTPVEEMEPYVVRLATPDGVEEWHVEPRNNPLALVAVFGHRHPHAKAAAEAECKRLNAEYRKEQEK